MEAIELSYERRRVFFGVIVPWLEVVEEGVELSLWDSLHHVFLI